MYRLLESDEVSEKEIGFELHSEEGRLGKLGETDGGNFISKGGKGTARKTHESAERDCQSERSGSCSHER